MNTLTVIVAICLLAQSVNAWNASDASVSGPANREDAVERLQAEALGPSRREAYRRLEEIAQFGHRFSGSKGLEDAIDWALKELQVEFGSDHVWKEAVMVPQWVRGEEDVYLHAPDQKAQKLDALGIGGMVGTEGKAIHLPIVAAEDWEELEEIYARDPEVVKGSVVLLAPDCDWEENSRRCYSRLSSPFRREGPSRAATFGAAAYLVKSTGSAPMPHTGSMVYEEGVNKIPGFALRHDDADRILALVRRHGQRALNATMRSTAWWNADKVLSHNVVAEWRGSELPDEYVIVGGHIDTWDLSHGSQDDGGGCMISWEALSLFRKTGLRPKRTVRLVLWTNEEFGMAGAQVHFDNWKQIADRVTLAMESDFGTFKPFGMEFTGSEAAQKIMAELTELAGRKVGAPGLTGGGGGADIGPWMAVGVPGASPWLDNNEYMRWHHTRGDTLDRNIDPDVLADLTALWAAITYLVADYDTMLPR